MTSRINSGSIAVAAKAAGKARVNQAAIMVAVSVAPPQSNAQINSAVLMIAARRYPIQAFAPLDGLVRLTGGGCCNSVPHFKRDA